MAESIARKEEDSANSVLTEYDVQYWFWRDPAACIGDPRAQKILREADHPFRFGIFNAQLTTKEVKEIRAKHRRQVRERVLERKSQKQSVSDSVIYEEEIARAEQEVQEEIGRRIGEKISVELKKSWWCDAVAHICKNLECPPSCAECLADYFSGFQFVPSEALVRRSKDWRRIQVELGNDVPSVNAPQSEPLDNRLLPLMTNEVQKTMDFSRKKALLTVAGLWWSVLGRSRWHKLVREPSLSPNPITNLETLKRIDRRSRSRLSSPAAHAAETRSSVQSS